MIKKIESKIIKILDKYTDKVGLNLRYFFKNGTWMAMKSIVSAIGGIILSVAFARFSTKDIYGQYSFLISILTIISFFSLPGLNTAIFRANSKKYDGVYLEAIKLSFKFSILGMVVLLFFGLYFLYIKNNSAIGISLLFCVLFFPLLYVYNKWDILLQSKEKFYLSAKYYSVMTIISYCLVAVAVFLRRENLIVIFSTYIILNSFFNVIFHIKTKKYLENKKEEDGWKKSGFIVSAFSLVNLAYDNLDKILLAIFLNPASVAIYSISMVVCNQLKNFINSIIRIYVPKIYKLDIEIFFNKTKRVMPFLFFVVGGMILLVFLIVPKLIIFLYTENYFESIFYAQLSLIAIPFYMIVSVLTFLLNKEKKESFRIISLVVSGAITFALYFILIPIFGILGAIISSILFYVIQAILLYFYVYRELIFKKTKIN